MHVVIVRLIAIKIFYYALIKKFNRSAALIITVCLCRAGNSVRWNGIGTYRLRSAGGCIDGVHPTTEYVRWLYAANWYRLLPDGGGSGGSRLPAECCTAADCRGGAGGTGSAGLGSDVTTGGTAATVLAYTAAGRDLARHRLEYCV